MPVFLNLSESFSRNILQTVRDEISGGTLRIFYANKQLGVVAEYPGISHTIQPFAAGDPDVRATLDNSPLSASVQRPIGPPIIKEEFEFEVESAAGDIVAYGEAGERWFLLPIGVDTLEAGDNLLIDMYDLAVPLSHWVG